MRGLLDRRFQTIGLLIHCWRQNIAVACSWRMPCPIGAAGYRQKHGQRQKHGLRRPQLRCAPLGLEETQLLLPAARA
jgi:hypothetical protein